jgi:2-polyprenyl-3-methyl-5-hydroxy-6-metoxy-1,4-benzoquinol methylase
MEPDIKQSKKIKEMIKNSQLPVCCKAITGTVEDLNKKTEFDTIIYIDVLEHIKNDSAELKKAVNHLAKGGFLIIGVPANQRLYTKFDKAIGHYRRYNKDMLKSIVPTGMKQEKLIYLDSAGLLASFSNKILRQDYPTEKQVLFWSNVIVRFSKISDKVFRHSFGKQIIGVWKKV